MKLGSIEVSGITRIVENHKVVWNRYRNRWVKCINQEVKGGMSMEEMHEYLDDKVCELDERLLSKHIPAPKYHIWVNRETINVVKNRYKA